MLLMVSMSATLCGYNFKFFGLGSKNTVSEENRQLLVDMGVGINIGNSLDACDWNKKFTVSSVGSSEKSWGNPLITEQYIQALKEQGFGTIRIPVTYMNHIDKDGNIDTEWLSRIGTVVNWIIARDMYCIIDIHHDTGDSGWIKATNDSYEKNKVRVGKMITQIAAYFKDYSTKLILEGFNEMNDDSNHWDSAPAEAYKAYNKWNQLFVSKVRETGSNNSKRYLLINTYAATFKTKSKKYFELPKDSVSNRLLVGVHNYANLDTLQSSFDYINKLAREGFPIVIGEFGATAAAEFNRAEYASKYVSMAKANGYCAIWWDNGVNDSEKKKDSYIIIDRKTGEPIYEDIVKALTKK